MEVMFERVAGLDVGKASVTVCVRTPSTRAGRRRSETRTFPTMTRSLGVVRDWLVAEGVTVAAIESTSTYWKAPFYCLEEVVDVWLLNAQHMKAVPGRKSDVRDAEWIAQLLEHGLLRPSFVPPPDIRRLRPLTRYRDQLLADRTREMIRPELMLEDASIKLSAVVSSLKTVSARAMLAAMIDGEGDARVLAQMAKGKLRGKIPQLTEALTGNFDANHARLARSILDRLQVVEDALAELDVVIEAACAPWAHQIELLCTIPGVGVKVAQVFIAETGGDVQVPVRGASGRVGWARARDLRIRRQAHPGRRPAWEQMAQPHARRVRRLGRPHARQELPRRAARPADQAPRDGPGTGRGRAFDPGRRVLDAQT